MKTLLLVSELGAGFGHVMRLRPFARAADSLGYRCIFVTANPPEVWPLLDPEMSVRKVPVELFSNQISDYDASFVRDGAAKWRDLLTEVKPTAIVCEFSPLLLSVAQGWGIPILSTGYGHIVPPRAGACPDGMVEVITGLPELDPHSNLRSNHVGVTGTSVRRATAEPIWDVFAYLQGGAPNTPAILKTLAQSGLSGKVYVRGGDIEEIRCKLHGSQIITLAAPACMSAEYRHSAVIVHHGSTLMTEEAMIAGRPQLVFPIYPEHRYNETKLINLGVTPPSTVQDTEEALSLLTNEPAFLYTQSAQLWATEYEKRKRSYPSTWKLLQSIGVE